MGKFWSAHTHSKFSAKDGLSPVKEIVERAKVLEYPALGLTDHGNMAGAVQLYTNCKKNDIKPLPGIEAYVAFERNGKETKTMHLGLLSISEKGYRNLVGLSNHAHKEWARLRALKRSPGKAVMDFVDFARASEDGRLEGIVAMTGCWFGLLPEMLKVKSNTVDVRVANVLNTLREWFDDNLYLEIQNHGIKTPTQDEEKHAEFLYQIAQKQGLPIVINQDSHYVYPTEQAIHDTMKRLTSFSEDPEEGLFPGDGYHMVDDIWMQDYHEPHIYKAGMEGLDDLASKANVVIPELDTFKLKVPDTTYSGNPDVELEETASAALSKKIDTGAIPASKKAKYLNRIDEELEIIYSAGFAGYLMYAYTLCKYMRENDIIYNARGSAAGSMLCWLLEITPVDPIKYDLLFDRFLSKDRTKPPDIDLDVEHTRRNDVIQWMDENFNIVNISTWMKMRAQEDEYGKLVGSLAVRYNTYANKMGIKDLPMDHKMKENLMDLSVKEAFSGYGTHAAGLLVTPDEHVAGVVPLLHVVSSEAMVSSFDKDDIETLGLLKIDLLGLKTLSALRKMEEYTGVKRTDIPFNDSKVFSKMSKGETAGLFQLEGGSSRNGIRRLKPKNLNDVIASMALFRPGTMDSGATEDFINRRHKLAPIPERHEIISTHTKSTYGVLLYQEQVINVMRSVGLAAEEIEKVRKIIKSSRGLSPELEKLQEGIAVLARSKGMSDSDIAWLKEAFDAYAGYGFNKAHATSYGIVAYQTGYYAVHYPLEFWTAMLEAYIGSDQEKIYLVEAVKQGIRIFDAHVNLSGVNYSLDKKYKAIRKGLLAVPGVGPSAAEEIVKYAPYANLDELALKVNGTRVKGSKDLGVGKHPSECGSQIQALFEHNALTDLEREAK